MNSLFQLEIPKRNNQCAHQGERLLPGMEIYSLLQEEDKKFNRRDFCSACWEQVQKQEQIEQRSYWKSKIEHRKSFSDSSKVDRALILLKDMQQASEKQEAEIFVLCLFLARARQIALRQEIEKDGNIYQLYEVLRQEDYITVKACSLSHLEVEKIQKSLADKLTSSL